MNNYFSHDSNARNSDKILPLRMKLGAEGYAVYFMILERLREEQNYMSIKDYNMLAFDFRVGSDVVKSVINDFGLFHFAEDGKQFYSESFNKRMKKKDEKSKKLSVAGKKGMSKRWENENNGDENVDIITTLSENDNHLITTLSENDNHLITTLSENDNKKSKVKKSKVKNNIKSLAENEVSDSERKKFLEILFFEKRIKNPVPEMQRFINHYQGLGWKNAKEVQITDRVAVLRNWDTKVSPKYPEGFVQAWREVYQLSAHVSEDKTPMMCLITEVQNLIIEGQKFVIYCSHSVKTILENNVELFGASIQKLTGGRIFEYRYPVRNK